ncbi:MAG: hypothetical protein RIC36_15600 [Rhodospirillales bacterium]
MTGIITRLIAGGPERHTRLHDEKGNLTTPVDMLRDVPGALLRTIAEKFGYKGSALPWWPAPAIRMVAGLIKHDWQVLEFGSGRSTLWLAGHAGHVTAMEDHPEWYKRVTSEILGRNITNVDYRFAADMNRYSEPEGLPAASIDFAIVDGSVRSRCLKTAFKLIKPGGLIYLDDSDKDMTIPDGDTRKCDAMLEVAESEGKGKRRCFTGFAPQQAFAKQGTLFFVAGD